MYCNQGFPKLYKVGNGANDGLRRKEQKKSMPPVGIEPRTSCDLLWCLSDCAKLTFGCQSESLRPS